MEILLIIVIILFIIALITFLSYRIRAKLKNVEEGGNYTLVKENVQYAVPTTIFRGREVG